MTRNPALTHAPKPRRRSMLPHVLAAFAVLALMAAAQMADPVPRDVAADSAP